MSENVSDSFRFLEGTPRQRGEARGATATWPDPAENWTTARPVGAPRLPPTTDSDRTDATFARQSHSLLPRSGASFLSCDDLRLHYGLGDAKRADEIRVRWPSGLEEIFPGPEANRQVLLDEGKGRSTEPRP